MLAPVTILIPVRPDGTIQAPTRRVLFVVSRDLPERYNSLAYAFDGDRGVRVIFDRRRADRRRQNTAPLIERRQEDRRSADRDWRLRSVGWIQIDPE
jgi:hypothetical protein